MSLSFHVYRPGSSAIFDVTSTLITGEKDAFLIDAPFQKKYAEELAERIKGSGRQLPVIFASHFDSDCCFGLDVLQEVFPDARILSTAQTAWMISASRKDKPAVWKDTLGDDASSRLLVPEAVTALPKLEGEEVRIATCPEDEMHSFLCVPSDEAASASQRAHTPGWRTPKTLANWTGGSAG